MNLQERLMQGRIKAAQERAKSRRFYDDGMREINGMRKMLDEIEERAKDIETWKKRLKEVEVGG